MNERLTAYLQRIGYEDGPKPDYATLEALHRAHLLEITYENLDIHLGGTLTLDIDAIFQKIVVNKRGGWCFEMNGLFAWALREIGFDVTLLAGTVNRHRATGLVVEGNHLILLVKLDEGTYLADVGFGNGFREPLPLAEGTYMQDYLEYGLRLEGDRWWFTNHPYGGAGFDFTLDPHELADFADQCEELQTSPESGFVQTTVCHRHRPGGVVTLRGVVLTAITETGRHERIIDSFDEYREVLTDYFDLNLDESAALWEKVWARHQVWANQQS